MTRSQIVRLLWLAGFVLSALVLPAEAATTPPAGAARARPSPPPLPPSPVAQFRQLLDASPDEQARQLAAKPERSRRILEAKLREYQLLSPEDRDLRLRATELRWYLRPLMEVPPTNRVGRIGAIPGEYLALVEERLQQWDQLPADVQRQILENETVIQYFLRIRSETGTGQQSFDTALPATEREQLEREMARWQTLPPDRRLRISEQFQRFFELPRKEQRKTLDTFTPEERQQVEDTLQAFAALPAGQRRVCVASFRKFAQFSPAERAEFLRNADRWKSLTPQERETWRMLVTRLPPLPPMLVREHVPPVPPTPPRARLAATSSPPPLP